MDFLSTVVCVADVDVKSGRPYEILDGHLTIPGGLVTRWGVNRWSNSTGNFGMPSRIAWFDGTGETVVNSHGE